MHDGLCVEHNQIMNYTRHVLRVREAAYNIKI